jgi:hypothetical protein
MWNYHLPLSGVEEINTAVVCLFHAGECEFCTRFSHMILMPCYMSQLPFSTWPPNLMIQLAR